MERAWRDGDEFGGTSDCKWRTERQLQYRVDSGVEFGSADL